MIARSGAWISTRWTLGVASAGGCASWRRDESRDDGESGTRSQRRVGGDTARSCGPGRLPPFGPSRTTSWPAPRPAPSCSAPPPGSPPCACASSGAAGGVRGQPCAAAGGCRQQRRRRPLGGRAAGGSGRARGRRPARACHPCGGPGGHARRGWPPAARGGREPGRRESLRRADLVLDGLVGIGGSPGLREPAAGVVAALDDLRANGHGPLVVAVDLPSGVDPDTGETPAAHVRADVTVTFGAPQTVPVRAARRPRGGPGRGRRHRPAAGAARGARARRRAADHGRRRAALWPVPGAEDDKYRRGVVGVVAGSPAYTGAAVLARRGALRSGAGMVRYVGPDHAAEQVRMHWPEAVVGTGRVQAWVLGSGVDPDADDGQADAVREGLASGLPCVVDAGALALLAAGRLPARRALGAHRPHPARRRARPAPDRRPRRERGGASGGRGPAARRRPRGRRRDRGDGARQGATTHRRPAGRAGPQRLPRARVARHRRCGGRARRHPRHAARRRARTRRRGGPRGRRPRPGGDVGQPRRRRRRRRPGRRRAGRPGGPILASDVAGAVPAVVRTLLGGRA